MKKKEKKNSNELSVNLTVFEETLNYLSINSRYLHGMYAFGLIETGFYREAEKHALKVSFKTLLIAIL